MDNIVNVFELGTIKNSIKDLNLALDETETKCNEGLSKVNRVLENTKQELNISKTMLDTSKIHEAYCLTVKLEVEVRLAKALADEATAMSTGNHVLITAATVQVANIMPEVMRAREEYNKAVKHREQLEHRYELAEKCVNIASEMCETLNMKYTISKSKLETIVSRGSSRLNNAYQDLYRYLERVSPEVLVQIERWENWKPTENQPIKPDDINNRQNVSKDIVNAILQYLYVTDLNFRTTIDNLRRQFKETGDDKVVVTKIKKNVVGRLAEEIVIRTYLPLGKKIETQHKSDLDDGSYTKIDMILYELKAPLILGRGEGMGTREGSNLAIEVKSGNKDYLYSQLAHMEKQAQGHKDCEISCTVCTRDIKDLSIEKEEELRTRMRLAGSPILGMLPRKKELDDECIKFVIEGVE